MREYVADSTTYLAVRVDNAKIFTNRRDNITVMQGKRLVPRVSLQSDYGIVLPDNENFILTRKLKLWNPPVYFKGTVVSLVTGEPTNYNYYHWFFDCLPRIAVAASLTERETALRYLVPDDIYSFQRESLDHFGITEEKRISSAKVPFLAADRIIATSPTNPTPEKFPLWVLDFVRDRFLPLATVSKQRSLIYVSRNDSSNARRLLNEDELWEPLSKLGFSRVELSKLSLKEQISLFADARIVVSVHGAGLTNLAFAPEGTMVYELFAESYQPQMFMRISDALRLRYSPVICQAHGDRAQLADLTISQESIRHIVSGASAAMNNSANPPCP